MNIDIHRVERLTLKPAQLVSSNELTFAMRSLVVEYRDRDGSLRWQEIEFYADRLDQLDVEIKDRLQQVAA